VANGAARWLYKTYVFELIPLLLLLLLLSSFRLIIHIIVDYLYLRRKNSL
jgi:hypothetical protein